MNIFTKTKNTIKSKVTKTGTYESIDDIGKGVVCGDIILLPEEYAEFWGRISQDRQSCARYMARMVVTLLNFEQDLWKAERSLVNKSAIVSSSHLINLLLNTIQFIDMFIGFDPKNEAYVSAMDKYELAKKTNPIFKNKSIYDGLQELSKRRVNKGQAAVKMIVECSSLESTEEILHNSVAAAGSAGGSQSPQKTATSASLSGKSYDDVEESALDKAQADFPFTFTGLSRMAKSDISPMIFDELLKQLEGAGSALSSMAHMQGRTLALMFMLREFLTICPTADHMWMQRACLVLIGLYKWPKPYGIIAKDLLDFIYLERRSPGCHLRERIMEENPSLHPLVMLETRGLKYTSLRPKGKGDKEEKDGLFSPPSRTCPISFVFLDKSVPLCCTHKHLLLQTKKPSTPSVRSMSSSKSCSTLSRELSTDEADEMRICIISNAFDTDFFIFPNEDGKKKPKIKDPLGLRNLSEEDITVLYCQVMEVLERAKTLPVNAGLGGERTDKDLTGLPYTIPGGLSKLYRESLLASLLQRLHPDKTFAPRRSSDEKVNHVVRQSRRTSLLQQENVTDRQSVIDVPAMDEQSAIINNARAESKRLAQVLSPDEMALIEGNSDDEGGQEDDVQAKTVFSTVENTVYDPVLFGQHAPLVPDSRLEVIDVKKKKHNVGSESESSCHHTTEDYSYSTNEAGYLHHKSDVDSLLGVIEKAKQEWDDTFGRDCDNLDVAAVQDSFKKSTLGDSIVDATAAKKYVNNTEKLVIKIVLMGSNLIVHRFLGAYVALSTQKGFSLSDYLFEVFVIPQGKNHLGIFLARSDKWYRRHIFDSFKGSLGICPQYSAVREFSSFDFDGSNIQKCLPVTNLRSLLQNYMRQATQRTPLAVYECLCWAAFEEESSTKTASAQDNMDMFNQKSTPHIIIPFVMQVQLGLLAQLEQFRDKPSSMSKLERQNEKMSLHSQHEKGTLSMRECFADKDAMFSGTELSLQYLPSSITAPSGGANKAAAHQNARSPSTSQVDTFATLSITNFPCHNSSRDDFSKKKEGTDSQLSEQLIMESQMCKGSFADAFQNRRKNAKAMDGFLEALHDKSSFSHPQHIGAAEINATNPKDSFHILVDGALYGPFSRLIIRSCSPGGENSNRHKSEDSQLPDEGLSLPVMTYMPLHR